jgi:hypothetical protein
MAEAPAPLTALILTVLLVWLGVSALYNTDVEARVARHFDQLLKARATGKRPDVAAEWHNSAGGSDLRDLIRRE